MADDLGWIDELPDEAQRMLLAEAEREARYRKLERYRPYPKQREFHRLGATCRERLLRAGNQQGKALPDETPVLTPDGWRPIGELAVGDVVMGGDGLPCRVWGVYRQGVRPVWRLSWSDGVTTLADADHLWLGTRNGHRRVDATRDLRFDWPHSWYLPLVRPEFPERPLPIDPYRFGRLLGMYDQQGRWFHRGEAERKALIDLGVADALALVGGDPKANVLPPVYEFAPSAVRLAMLRGILSAVFSRSEYGKVRFRCKDYRIFSAIVSLAQSLGGTSVMRNLRNAASHDTTPSFPTLFAALQRSGGKYAAILTVAGLLEESARPVRRLVGLEPAGERSCTCIAVDSSNRTYVIDGYIVTHNTYCVAAEMAMHLTGRYPPDWEGRRWDRPIVCWAAGETAESTRDNPQRALLGLPGEEGTGMIPRDCLGLSHTQRGMASGTADLYDFIRVKHHTNGRHDGWSMLRFRYYAQGRKKWQGPPVDFVWFDEEPPSDVYDEGLARTIATGGMAAISFTPLQGATDVVLRFLRDGGPDRGEVNLTIEDAEHISESDRARIIASIPAHEREARIRGIPVLGSGRVFPVEESLVAVNPFELPRFWPRIVGLDFGWDHPTAAVWLAWDRDTDTVYVYDCYRRSQATVEQHAAVLRAKGAWIPVAWPHDGLNDTAAGPKLAKQYRDCGVSMLAEHAKYDDESKASVEAGVMDMLSRMETGRFRVFATLGDWFDEFRLYHRKDGRIVKERDDLLSATRYGLMMLRFARVGGERKVELPVARPFDPSVGY